MDNLKEKINQLFILGYEGEDFRANNDLVNLLKNGLGGVIFFTQNIIKVKQFKEQVKLIKSVSKIPPFLSIDEEGGRVERFENLNKNYPDGKKYLSAKIIADKCIDFEKKKFSLKGYINFTNQLWNICDDLKKFGLNMNFAPVLDVNSNPDNPIIGERAYSDDPEIVILCAKTAADYYAGRGIIPVFKHFPGHGDTKKDSHLELPVVDMPFEELKNTHIYPYDKILYDPKLYLCAIMVAHVHYTCFDGEAVEGNLTPASASKNVLNYLRKNLIYEGVVISDDMEMGGIKMYSPIEAVTKMLKAGVNCFIYRNCTKEVVELLKELEYRAKEDDELRYAVLRSCNKKIYRLKKVFDIINL